MRFGLESKPSHQIKTDFPLKRRCFFQKEAICRRNEAFLTHKCPFADDLLPFTSEEGLLSTIWSLYKSQDKRCSRGGDL